MSQIAVVVINHNGANDVLECLRSVRAQTPAQIVVIDNASTDGSDERVKDEFADATFVANARNTGFAAAANQGVRLSTTKYVFLVNADAVLAPGCLVELEKTLDATPKAAAVGALVRNPDGGVQPTKRAFPTFGTAVLHGIVGIFRPNNPGTRSYLLTDDDFTQARKVDWVAGPAVALRREAFDAVGGFDEAYFFFVEDVDLCKRLSLLGWEVWFEPGAEVTHRWGGSWTERPLKFLWLHQWNLFRYVRKFYRGGWILAWPLIAAGLVVRFTILAMRWLITKRSVPEHARAGGGT